MLRVSNLRKNYAGQPLLEGISFSVAAHETICLLGASGSGKSTILRIIAGLEDADVGQVFWQDQDISNVPVHLRDFGLMFQDYALFPHRSVEENVAFGLRMHRMPANQIHERVYEVLDLVNLASFAKRKVTDLSGGEQQRVALARALAPNPKLLMLDEPLGALDRTLREQLLEELRRILHTTGIPAIYVTHDQEEAFWIADRLLLLHQGEIVQAGSPSEVYEHPVSPWVARFFGLGNLVPGEVIQAEPLQIRTNLGYFNPDCPESITAGDKVTLLLRPGGTEIIRSESEVAGNNSPGVVEGQVTDVVYRGDGFRVDLSAGEMGLRFYLQKAPRIGDSIRIKLADGGVVCLRNDDPELPGL